MHYILLQFLVLLFAVFLLIVLAQKLKIAYPLLLVLGGLVISYIPGMPVIEISPDLIFLIFLPPLLYDASKSTSWSDLLRWKRAICLLAVGLVIFTSTIVAVLVKSWIPGFTLAIGFLLGGIVAPPDALAASAVLKRLKIPKRITTILEGESLVNDASSLIVIQFAMAAVMTGEFSLMQATLQFFVITAGGIAIGLIVAYIFWLIQKYLPVSASVSAAFTLITPYFMYLAADHFHLSGVMAVVSGGIFLSDHTHGLFSSVRSRVQIVSTWSTLVMILNGLVFILIGLELPAIIKGLDGFSLSLAWQYGLTLGVIVILIRMVWIFPATFVPRWLFKSVRTREANPGWKGPVIIGWAGMRGVVSLAAALSIPMQLADKTPFPYRSLIIFVTFVVILITLVFQGLTLPLIVKGMKVTEIDPQMPESEQEVEIQQKLNHVMLDRIDHYHTSSLADNAMLREFRNRIIQQAEHEMAAKDADKIEVQHYHNILQDLYHVQRTELNKIRKEKIFDNEVIRKMEMKIVLAEMILMDNEMYV